MDSVIQRDSLEMTGSSSEEIAGMTGDEAPLLRKNNDKPRLTLFVVLLCGVATIGGFLFGYDTGVVSGALVLIKVRLSNY